MTGETRRRVRAFTLVELLVVVGIIGVLVALLLPSLNRAREQAKRVNCAAHLAQIGQALLMYAGQNRGYFPPRLGTPLAPGAPPVAVWKVAARGAASGYDNGTLNHRNFYGASLLVPAPYGGGANYLPNNDVFFCPGDLVRAPYRKPPHFWGPAFQTDTDITSSATSTSYWHYYFPEATLATAYQPAANIGPQDLLKSENYKMTVKRPSEKAVYIDQYLSPNWMGSGYLLRRVEYQTFHKEGLNALYIDGHAKWIKAGQVEDYMTRNNLKTSAFFYWIPIATANEDP